MNLYACIFITACCIFSTAACCDEPSSVELSTVINAFMKAHDFDQFLSENKFIFNELPNNSADIAYIEASKIVTFDGKKLYEKSYSKLMKMTFDGEVDILLKRAVHYGYFLIISQMDRDGSKKLNISSYLKKNGFFIKKIYHDETRTPLTSNDTLIHGCNIFDISKNKLKKKRLLHLWNCYEQEGFCTNDFVLFSHLYLKSKDSCGYLTR